MVGECLYCGKEFTHTRQGRRKYCDKWCQMDYLAAQRDKARLDNPLPPMDCKECGKPISEDRLCHAMRYCTDECREESRRRRSKIKARERRKTEGHKEYERKRKESMTDEQKQRRSEIMKKSYAKRAANRIPLPDKVCGVCGCNFPSKGSRKYCSGSCGRIATNKQIRSRIYSDPAYRDKANAAQRERYHSLSDEDRRAVNKRTAESAHQRKMIRIAMEAPKAIEEISNTLETLNPMDAITNRHAITTRHSGVAGITWEPSKNKWRVRVYVLGRRYSVGYFYDVADAIQARRNVNIRELIEPKENT